MLRPDRDSIIRLRFPDAGAPASGFGPFVDEALAGEPRE
jgi:hypothetical protein